MDDCDVNNVLFLREKNNIDSGVLSNSDPESDNWDDTALIKAYDKAISLAKEEVSKRMNERNQVSSEKVTKAPLNKKRHNVEKNKPWKVGDLCRAPYSKDGQFYEALILSIEGSDLCEIEYLGYGNSEFVNINQLLNSAGAESRLEQLKAAKAESESEKPECNGSDQQMEFECQSSTKKPYTNNFVPFSFSMPPAPPLPPQLMAKLPENDADALSSMLMSWYVSGFHTGYYHGLKQGRKNSKQT